MKDEINNKKDESCKEQAQKCFKYDTNETEFEGFHNGNREHIIESFRYGKVRN